jgi:hypothetical protein
MAEGGADRSPTPPDIIHSAILLTTHGAFKFRFGRDASFPAVVVIRHQYPTLIGPARLGRLEHKEDFTADRHRRTAEGGPKAYVSIYPAWMLQHFWRPLGAKPRTLP